MRKLVIWNTKASSTGTANALKDEIEMHSDIELVEDLSPAEIYSLLNARGDQSYDSVFAAGGDGSINFLVNILMKLPLGRRPGLGLLPLGTGNDLARTLELNSLEAARSCLFQGYKKRPIDLIKLTSQNETKWCANMITGGVSSEVSSGLDDEAKRFWGAFAYLRQSLKVLPRIHAYDIAVEFDRREELNLKVSNIIIANGRSAGGGIILAPHAQIDDGFMDCLFILEPSLANLAELTTSLMRGDYIDCDAVIFKRLKTLSLIKAEPEFELSVDGEDGSKPPFVVELIGSQLNICVPT